MSNVEKAWEAILKSREFGGGIDDNEYRSHMPNIKNKFAEFLRKENAELGESQFEAEERGLKFDEASGVYLDGEIRLPSIQASVQARVELHTHLNGGAWWSYYFESGTKKRSGE